MEEDLLPPGQAEWLVWLRDDVRMSMGLWLLASAALLLRQPPWLLRLPSLLDLVSRGLDRGDWLWYGWALATFVSCGSWSGLYQFTVVFRPHAMRLPFGSALVFSSLRRPATGRLVVFLGHGGELYVRRVRAVQPEKGGPCQYLQTVGDVPGVGEDRWLYSRDGSEEWLHVSRVQGVLVAGPIPQVLGLLICATALSPTAAISFLIICFPLAAVSLTCICSVGGVILLLVLQLFQCVLP